MFKLIGRVVRIALSVLVLIAFVSVPGAAAQGDGQGNGQGNGPCYPDGCGPGPTKPPDDDLPVCDKNKTRVKVGEIVQVTCQKVPHGHRIRIIVDGTEVTSGIATPLATFRPVQTGTATLKMQFSMPDVDAGNHGIHAVGPDYTVPVGNGRLIVAAGGGGGGALAFTGSSIVGLLIVAALLLLVGYALVRRFRDKDEFARP